MNCDAVVEQKQRAKAELPNATILAHRVFSLEDQKHFASLSGDCNPMHLDELYARRTQAGAPVVHGIHLLLWALDSLAAAQPDLPKIRRIRAEFGKFVYLGERVEATAVRKGSTGMRISISVGDSPRTKVAIDFGDVVEASPEWVVDSLERVLATSGPIHRKFEDLHNNSGRVPFHLSRQDASASFPFVARWIGAQRVAALASTSYLVGMVSPGLHSIYSGVSVTVCEDPGPEAGLAFRVVDSDSRFRSIEQEIAGGGLRGTVSGFARNPPIEQVAMQSLVGVVGPSEFAGSLALIVGGSRGLGELTAKLIAAGGGDVVITWKSGKEDAERVAREIRLCGGSCTALEYDSQKSASRQIASLSQAPTHAYYFATPSIFRPQSDVFSSDRLNEFLSVYVDGFWQLARSLQALRPDVSLYYPSSVAVAERPVGMTEYAMAKVAGEVLCADLNVSLAPMKVFVTRLPRLLTDQTATVTPVDTADPLETMLSIVREVQSRGRHERASDRGMQQALQASR